MEQLVILVIIGLISLVNWLMQRSAELREQRKHERSLQGIPEGNPFQPAEEPAPKPPRKDPAEEMRKLMEALGVSLEEAPPPQQSAPPPELPPIPAFQPPPKQKPPTPKRPAQRTSPLQPQHHLSSRIVSETLRSRDSVRQAIVIREILGPPKAFQPEHGS